MQFPKKYRDLLKDETRAFVYLATIMDDGTPQVTPVWFDSEDEFILINTAAGRIKDHNMQARPNVALVIQDPNDPYRYVQVRGKVVDRTTQGADAHIDRLSLKYLGNPVYQNRTPGMQRVIYKIQPESFDRH
jgi:PPOX class probable F420-dependent enzyme